jgi:hypothetical protein
LERCCKALSFAAISYGPPTEMMMPPTSSVSIQRLAIWNVLSSSRGVGADQPRHHELRDFLTGGELVEQRRHFPLRGCSINSTPAGASHRPKRSQRPQRAARPPNRIVSSVSLTPLEDVPAR